jgi:dihydrofolate synthase / folylpolyglutamate synthase
MKAYSREYRQHLSFLYNLQFFGIKLGLENIRALLASLGDPHLNYPVIHIAGTNGKGSTAAMIASILISSGYRTGLYTSPHLMDFSERICINGKPIPEDEMVCYTMMLKKEIVRRRATFFEATSAMAFRYFADHNVDIAVIETGLGGRLDATNIVSPLLSIITSIGLDHTEHLGSSISEIAHEKGGIIKRGVPCILGNNEKPVLDVIRKICRENQSDFISVQRETTSKTIEASLAGTSVEISTRNKIIKDLFISLPGEFQIQNARTAVLAVDYLVSSGDLTKIKAEGIREGMGNIRQLTGLRGRIDILRKNPLVLGDVGHNPAAIERLCSTMAGLCSGEFIAVFGLMRDKDIDSILPSLSRLSRMVIAVQPQTDRALKSPEIVDKFHNLGHKAINGGTVKEGIETALAEVRVNDTILIVGSHYVVGEAMEFFSN